MLGSFKDNWGILFNTDDKLRQELSVEQKEEHEDDILEGSETSHLSPVSLPKNEDLSNLLWKIKLNADSEESESSTPDFRISRVTATLQNSPEQENPPYSGSFSDYFPSLSSCSTSEQSFRSDSFFGRVLESKTHSEVGFDSNISVDVSQLEDSAATTWQSQRSPVLYGAYNAVFPLTGVSSDCSKSHKTRGKQSPSMIDSRLPLTSKAVRDPSEEVLLRGIEKERCPSVSMVVILAHIDKVAEYAESVRKLFLVYSIDVFDMSKVEDGVSYIQPGNVARIVSQYSRKRRVVLVGPNHVNSGTCHFQNDNGLFIEVPVFVAVQELLESFLDKYHVPVVRQEDAEMSFCSSSAVFVQKMMKRIERKAAEVNRCRSLKMNFPVESSKSRIYRLRRSLKFRWDFRDRRLLRRLSTWNDATSSLLFYIFSTALHLEDRVHVVHEDSLSLFTRVAQIIALESDFEKELRLLLLKELKMMINELDNAVLHLRNSCNQLMQELPFETCYLTREWRLWHFSESIY